MLSIHNTYLFYSHPAQRHGLQLPAAQRSLSCDTGVMVTARSQISISACLSGKQRDLFPRFSKKNWINPMFRLIMLFVIFLTNETICVTIDTGAAVLRSLS